MTSEPVGFEIDGERPTETLSRVRINNIDLTTGQATLSAWHDEVIEPE